MIQFSAYYFFQSPVNKALSAFAYDFISSVNAVFVPKFNIKYCFTDYNLKILTPTQYMNWDASGWQNSGSLSNDEIETCKENIKYINKNAKLMNREELEEFINFDYSKQIIELANKLKLEVEPQKIYKTNLEKQEQSQEEKNTIDMSIM